MNFQVTQENLAKALNSVARVANTKNTLPILANIMIKTIGTRVSISATNLDIAITHFIGSKVSEEGSITVPAKLMQDFISSLPSGIIELKLKENRLHIKTEQYKSIINGMSTDEFPVMPAIDKGVSWSLSSTVFKKGLQQVAFAASNDDTRPALTGIYLYTSDGKLYMAATDSYRLSEKELSTTKENIKLLIPANAAQDLLRIISDEEQNINITHDDQQVLFKVGEIELVTRLIESKYPDYKKLIPNSFSSTAIIKRTDFLNIAKVSSLFARESAGSITIEIKDNSISIQSIASQLGENTAKAQAVITGEGSITLNSRYLIDALQAFSDDEVEFCFNGKLEPCIVRGVKHIDYTHVIMPLKS